MGASSSSAPEGSLRFLFERARAAAAGELRAPSLYSVLVDLGPADPLPHIERTQWGFQEKRRRRLGGHELRVCWVEVRHRPLAIAVTAAGTYGEQQLRQLASVQGLEFPPRDLDLDHLQLEPLDVLRYLREHPPRGAAADLASVSLGLCCHEGRLAWRALHEIPGVGFRTLFLAAGDGRVLHEKLDPWVERAPEKEGA